MKKLATAALAMFYPALILPLCFAQEVTFSEQQVITTDADRAQLVYSSDIDGDGDMDVLSASKNDDKIAWYENMDGLGTFGPQQVITIEALSARSVCSADLDGDGDMEVLSASLEDGKIAWYENTDGFGSFGPQQVITTEANEAHSVYSADLDGDGDMDVLSASNGLEDRIAWYENTDGLGTFGPMQVITTNAHGAYSVYSSDLDGDGGMDVLSASRTDCRIAWYENTDGLGSFGPQQVITVEAQGAESVYSADLDGDGDMDVLSAAPSDMDDIAWYENIDGLGTFGPQQIITSEAHLAKSVYSADLDNDGDMDVLSASGYYDWGEIAWYENTDGLGTFGPMLIINTEVHWPISVYSADLDGDGDMDVLSASEEDDKIAWYRNDLYIGYHPLPFGLIAPDSGSIVSSEDVVLEWEATTDPDNDFYIYWIYIAEDFDQLENNEIVGTTQTTWTFSGEIGIQYWWSVLARDNQHNETWADQVYSFTIDLDAVEEAENCESPSRYEITSIYPNPFNASTTVTVALPEATGLRIAVYNSLGREVAFLADSHFPSGHHHFTFNAGRDLPAGIYFIHASASSGWSEVQKVVLMK